MRGGEGHEDGGGRGGHGYAGCGEEVREEGLCAVAGEGEELGFERGARERKEGGGGGEGVGVDGG